MVIGQSRMLAAVIQFGGTSQTSWTAQAGNDCTSGSTVTLNGFVATLGSPSDNTVNWTWHSGNAGLLPAQMPSTDGTAATLITSFSATAPFGSIPTHGAFLKIEPTKTGAVIISGKASANASQPLVFVTCDKNNPTTILSAQITAWDTNVTEWTYNVDADHVYYFFQLSYPDKLTAYRFTLRGIAFDDNPTQKITVYTIGDSTMANKSAGSTERGWGMLFSKFIDLTKANVSNHAVNGRSTLSFINEGRWNTVRSALKEGDFVLIQFGHNDEKTDASLHTDPQTTFKQYLTRFVNETRSAGATPVLVTPIVRRIFGSDGNIQSEHTEYSKAMRELASELNVQLIDMDLLSACYENIAGIEGSRALHEYFPGKEIDNTHLCQFGAYITARCVAEQIAANAAIDIPVNSNPETMAGAFSSTLAYARNAFSNAYPDEAVPSTLISIDASVRNLRKEARQALATAEKPADATFAVINHSFEEGNSWYNAPQATYPMGWQVDKSTSGTTTVDIKTNSSGGFNYFYASAPTINYIDMNHTIVNLPDGNYELSALVNATAGAQNGCAYLYAASGESTSKANVTTTGSWVRISTSCDVTSGQMRIGLRSENGWCAQLADVRLTITEAHGGDIGASSINILDKYEEGVLTIADEKATAPIVFDKADHSVVGVAANALSDDIKAICNQQPAVGNELTSGTTPIIVGTLGQSTFIDNLAKSGKIDVSGIEGKWEAYTLQVVNDVQTGIGKALVIAGSTPRGTAYGIFELSRLMGVSPWIWWADVKPATRSALYATEGEITVDEPSVRFRGIFINDEDWGLEPWAAKNMDTDVKNIGPRTYEKVFELLLRLRANIMWPAMHPCSTAFWKIAENPQLAAKYDIVLGSSHCEPMLRNNVGEWTASSSSYNYATNPSGVQDYWRQRVEESKNQDVMYTLGMRGVHDGAIQGYSGASNIAAGLTKIMSFQRSLIHDIVNEDVTKVPQTFIPYKEVLDAYNAGLKVPDDVTLTWVDDNHGFIRQMPTDAEQARSGSNGIYYHISYWGTPQDYLWLSTIGPSQISYELTRGYQQGIQRLWIINVGDIKPAEAELEFCMDLAWDIQAWGPTKAAKWSRGWAARTFGEEVADEIGAIKQEYYRLAAAGKPEHVSFIAYTNEEIDQRIADYKAIADRVMTVKGSIRPELQDAYFQLIEYPVVCAYKMNVKHLRAQQSLTEAGAGHGEKALQYADDATAAYNDIQTLTQKYNSEIAGGKWNGIMSSAPRGLATFGKPAVAKASDVSPVDSNVSMGGHVTVPAASYTSSSASIKNIDGLGMQAQAVCVWPMDLTSYSRAADAPYVEYSVPVKAGENTITPHFLPTFPLHAGGTLRYAAQLTATQSSPSVYSIATTATSSVWSQNVLRGWATGKSLSYEATTDGTVTLRLYLMDPGIALCEIAVDQPADATLTDKYMVNADFELSAKGVVNTGGATVRGVPYGWSINKDFPGNSRGINSDGSNKHGDNSCWFYNKPMPSDFELYQVIRNLEPGHYRLSCRLGSKTGYLGTLRLFAGDNVQYFGKETDYASKVFVTGEHNTFAAHSGTSDYNTLQNMFVDFDVTDGQDVRVGIRTGNKKSDGSTDNSGETGTFRVDYFQLYLLGSTETGISTPYVRQPSAAYSYTLSGYPVSNPHNGMYIVDGRKVVIK